MIVRGDIKGTIRLGTIKSGPSRYRSKSLTNIHAYNLILLFSIPHNTTKLNFRKYSFSLELKGKLYCLGYTCILMGIHNE